jgi:hypothetical protein
MPVAAARGFVSGVAGMPGDLESLARLLLNIQGPENFSMPRTKDEALAKLGQIFGANRVSLDTVLPTSEDIEARLPFRSASETPVGRAVTGASQLAGGFYLGPGSPARLITGIPQAVVKGGKDFVMAAGQPASRMFVGPKAKTWNQAKADEAARMEKAGVDPVEIWRQTGTFRGADGIPRQEISDQGARFLTNPERQEAAQVIQSGIDTLKQKIKPSKQKDLFPKSLTEARKEIRDRINRGTTEYINWNQDPSIGVRADTILSHPELYRAYPELADVTVVTGGYGGNARGSLSTLPSGGVGRGYMAMDIFDAGMRGDPRSTALHEMQHAVQTVEGMSPGGNTVTAFSDPRTTEIYKRRLAELQQPATFEEFQRVNKVPQERAQAAYEEYLKTHKLSITPSVERMVQEEAAKEYYRRLAGEAEARATQFRANMTPEQRAQDYPYSSYDIPEEDLLTKPPKEYSGGGALVKAVRAAQSVGREAPSVVIPSAVTRVQQAVRESKGDYGARRVQRAADEIPNLERMYKEEALRSAFTGDNAQAVMTMNPADFERFALEMVPHQKGLMPWTGEIDKYSLPTDEYIQYLQKLRGGFDDLPFLGINKQEQGLPLLPFISGHEGRHRSRALAASGQPTSLVRLVPRAELREPFPRRSQEEYLQALRDELDMTGNLVLPEGDLNAYRSGEGPPPRPAIVLPDIYAQGGQVKGPLSCGCED